MELGELIDDLYTKRAARLEAQRKTDEAKSLEDAAKVALVDMLQELKLNGAKGAIATASIKSIKMPKIVSWDDMYAYIRANNRFDLLHKRISELAWRDMLEAGELVPGTESVPDIKLSLTKSTRG